MRVAGTTIAEEEYKPDLEVLDRYQAYSAEVARLATLSTIAFGFLLSFAFHEGHRTEFGKALLQYRYFLEFGIVSLGAAIGLALAHRYVSTDVLASLIRSLRLAKVAIDSPSDEKQPDLEHVRHQEREELRRRLRQSGLLIAAASFCLVVGAACLALTALAAFAF